MTPSQTTECPAPLLAFTERITGFSQTILLSIKGQNELDDRLRYNEEKRKYEAKADGILFTLEVEPLYPEHQPAQQQERFAGSGWSSYQREDYLSDLK